MSEAESESELDEELGLEELYPFFSFSLLRRSICLAAI